jgi:hypothetical protein
VRGERHHGHVRVRRLELADPASGGDAVHHGHLHVEDHEIEVVAREGLAGLGAVVDDDGLVALLLEEAHEQGSG